MGKMKDLRTEGKMSIADAIEMFDDGESEAGIHMAAEAAGVSMTEVYDHLERHQHYVAPDRYVVVTDSKFKDGGFLFKAPAKKSGVHWTTHPHHAKKMNESQARFLASKLKYGNPRVMKYADALKLTSAVRLKED